MAARRLTLNDLRAFAAARTLFAPRDLVAAIDALGFVQMDPIRAPARAQDLILRHRVADYRAGDLERRFADLPLAEDYLHVYGALPARTVSLIHPRTKRRRFHVEEQHPRLARKILQHIERNGPVHPRDLVRRFGSTNIVNAWGGSSAATTRMLEVMHYRGVLRVVRRDNGVKVYGFATPLAQSLTMAQRADELLRMLIRLYAPVPMSSLRQTAAIAMRDSIPRTFWERALSKLLSSDSVRVETIDAVAYVWSADEIFDATPPDTVRFLAPFDPIVWDRRRFEHLWGWDYRFEAYTPAAQRRFGYYALPMLWRDRVIGWANAAASPNKLDVELGFVKSKPRDRAFAREIEREIDAMERSLRRH